MAPERKLSRLEDRRLVIDDRNQPWPVLAAGSSRIQHIFVEKPDDLVFRGVVCHSARP
ncbi:MAG: hypothetical protein WDN69_09610 [Aliidongia sp.]